MSESYMTTLWDEIGAWNDLQQVARDQRTAIVQRHLTEVWGTQERLQEVLHRVMELQDLGRQLRPSEPNVDTCELEQQVSTLRQQARAALNLNHELLRDICSYLDMIREVVFPHTLPPTYHHLRRGTRAEDGGSHSMSRTA